MQTNTSILRLPNRPNVVELAAMLDDKQLKSAQRRILRQALRETMCPTASRQGQQPGESLNPQAVLA